MRKTYGRLLHWLIAPALEYAKCESEPDQRPSIDDPLVVAIDRALRDRSRVELAEVLDEVLMLPANKWTPAEVRRISRVLTELGWTRRRAEGGGWYYQRTIAEPALRQA